MSDELEPVEVERSVADLSHRRILKIMALLVVAGSLAGLFAVGSRFAIGILIGGILSFVNYYWLKRSLKAIFDRAESGEKPRLFAFGYIIRYVVFGFVVDDLPEPVDPDHCGYSGTGKLCDSGCDRRFFKNFYELF